MPSGFAFIAEPLPRLIWIAVRPPRPSQLLNLCFQAYGRYKDAEWAAFSITSRLFKVGSRPTTPNVGRTIVLSVYMNQQSCAATEP